MKDIGIPLSDIIPAFTGYIYTIIMTEPSYDFHLMKGALVFSFLDTRTAQLARPVVGEEIDKARKKSLSR
jgi:hypothetical protein